MESPQRELRVGVVLNGRYRITELLGEGGMGLVYRGERLQLGRPVAIKFLHSPYAKSPKYMARFEREARAMSKLSHPYCVSVIDFGVHEEPYIVMDFVTGETLRDLLDRGPIGASRALQITRQLLAGLAHAHGQGVIHRDIKPGNVMVGEATGMGDHVRIFDFGLAKLHDPEGAQDHSMATVIGTPAYMSPEQTRAEPIDARADLYAVGVLLFEMLTGQKPFVAEDAYAVIRMQRDEPAPLLRERAAELSEDLEALVKKALQKSPDERYQTAAEFAQALDAVPEAGGRMSYVTGATGAAGVGTKRDQTPSTSVNTSAETSATRAPSVAVLGLLLVAGVGAFVYFTAHAPDRSGAPVSPASSPLTPSAAVPATGPTAAEPAPSVPSPSAPPAPAAALAEQPTSADAAVAEPSWDELLATADQALDQSAELEATPIAASGPDVRSISDVHKLIDKHRTDAAIVGLRLLRTKSPLNPYLPYLLGELYFERGWKGDALAKYREALKLSDNYKKRTSIHENAIRALDDDTLVARASVLLLRDVGAAALPALERAREGDSSPVIKLRAGTLAHQLQSQLAPK